MTVALEAGLVGRDEQTLRDFYTAAMGFAFVDRREFDVGTVCRLRRGAARLKLFFPSDVVDPVTAIEPWFRPGGWRYAALHLDRLDDVDALATAAEAAYGRVLIPPTSDLGAGRLALIVDPEGNAWELLAEARDGSD
jgi:catechol 2,3-dioxygenase-like lactoylglutathione lyase family enzyme